MCTIRVMGGGNNNMAKVMEVAIELVVGRDVDVSLEGVADNVDTAFVAAVGYVHLVA